MDFTLANMPAQRELSFPGSANSVALALVDFTFDDVGPAADIDFARSTSNTTFGTIGVKVWIFKGEVIGQAGRTL